MPRVITKVGATTTLLPVGAAFQVDFLGPPPTGPQYLQETQFQTDEPYCFVNRVSTFYRDTDKDTGLPDNSAGYSFVTGGLVVGGFFAPPNAIVVSAFGGSLKRYVAVTPKDFAFLTVVDPFIPNGDYTVSWVDNAPVGPVSSITGPDEVITFDLSTVAGFSSRVTSAIAFLAFGEGYPVSSGRPDDGGVNILYDTTDNPGRFSLATIRRNGATTGSYSAFSHSDINYTNATDVNYSQNVLTGRDTTTGTFWTYWEDINITSGLSDVRVISWQKGGYGGGATSNGYDIEFSDSADEALFTAFKDKYTDPGLKDVRLLGNKWIFQLTPFSDATHTVFVVSMDWTTYQRFDIPKSSAGGDVDMFFTDVTGYAFGRRDDAAGVYRLYTDGDPTKGPHGVDSTGDFTHSVSIP